MTDFNEIYSLYFKDVYKYVLSISRDEMIAEEITQETFFKALKNIDKFDGKCKLYVWLCQIAKNTFFTYKKKEKYHENLTETEDILVDSTIEQSLLSKESVFKIHKELHSLGEPYKEVFMLRVFGDLSFSQIGCLFEKTESWARVTYHRAKMKLKEKIECE
ncbi:MAG TPA: RNA polymerase subunit sigma [Lachnoclostridium sp.]|uniref:RNA polymerase sigma factor n=1 Tax=Lacrimispora sp. TaxID=2719234 RepID=UPI000EE8DF9B|nr:RNA polymerase sigma factor [Lacrimispora sp.]HCD46013.1 RNA polymerase subunit sigma [Lachnoclostridium sp.]